MNTSEVENKFEDLVEQFKEIPKKLHRVQVDCDYWWPKKEECMKMTAALIELGAINYYATMKGQLRSCCGNRLGCYLTREARAFVRQKI